MKVGRSNSFLDNIYGHSSSYAIIFDPSARKIKSSINMQCQKNPTHHDEN